MRGCWDNDLSPMIEQDEDEIGLKLKKRIGKINNEIH